MSACIICGCSRAHFLFSFKFIFLQEDIKTEFWAQYDINGEALEAVDAHVF